MKLLRANFEEVSKILRNDWDYTICIHGDKRKTKTTCGIHIARIIDPEFSFTDMSYTLEDLKHRTEYCPQYSIIFGDECIRALHKGDWNTPEQKEFEGVFFNVGFKNLVFIFITQVFEELPKWVRKTVDCKIYIPKRGRCKVSVRQEGEYMKDPYFKPMFEDTFPDITPEDKEIYRAIKKEKLQDAWGVESQRDRYVRRLRKRGVTVKQLSFGFQIGKSRIYEILKG